MTLYKFTHNGLTFEIGVPDGMTAAEAERSHLMAIDPGYRWGQFRAALITSAEYAQALAIAQSTIAGSTNFQILSSAIDFCCAHPQDAGALLAFQSALELYLQSLPSDATGEAIADRLTTLRAEYGC